MAVGDRVESDDTNPVDEKQLSLYLREYRKQLRKGAFGGIEHRKKRRERDRFARKKSRQLKKQINRNVRGKLPRRLLLRPSFESSPILDRIDPGRQDRWIKILDRDQSAGPAEIVLKDFTFIHEPRKTLEAFAELSKVGGEAIEANLHFDDQYCTDVAAYLVLSEVWPAIAGVFRGGRMGARIQKVVEALRLRKDLGMQLYAGEDQSDIWAFPKRSRRPKGSSKSENLLLEPQTKEKVADEFSDAVDDWLFQAAYGVRLSTSGRARLARIIGELLDNAERHSDPAKRDGSWSIAGFMARREEQGHPTYRCHLGILSQGASVAESMGTGPSLITKQVQEYCELHKGCGRSQETLASVVALQDGITSDPAAVEKERGGIGFQDVLQIVYALGQNFTAGLEPRMTIVSGRTCIEAKLPYLVGQQSGEDPRRMLWFNEQNKPSYPPDQNHVYDLNREFNGTIVGLTFVLVGDDLKALLDGRNQPE